MIRVCAAACAMSASVILAACASTQESAAQNATRDAADAAPKLVQSRTRIAPGQTGLEVITWQITDQGRRTADALQKHAAPAVAGVDEFALRKNGFILWAVKLEELDALRADLGGSQLDMRTWFGTATTWRELVSMPMGDAMVEINGVARERPAAQARLMARSWPVPMEDGTRISVELVPQVVQGQSQSSLLRNASKLAGDVILSCATSLDIQSGVAWLLTCDPGGLVETDAQAPERAREAVTLVGPPSPERPQASGKIGSRVMTLGAAILLASSERANEPSRRTVLVFVPHLGGSAFPVDDAAEPMRNEKP